MDRTKKILWAMLLYHILKALVEESSPTMVFAFYAHWMEMCSYLTRCTDGRTIRGAPHVWTYSRPSRFMEATLLASYTEDMFKSRQRLSRARFEYVCIVLGASLVRQDTYMRAAISVEKRVCIALTRLATGNTIKEIADQYSVGYTMAQRAICEYCKAVKENLQDLCIEWPSPDRMHTLSRQFERLKGIPFVVGAIDGSHLSIIAPTENAQDYYNRKGFHSILLQVIVSSDCCVWDYDVGWAGSIHDWKLFEQIEAGKRIKAGHLENYCLVGDAAYPPQPWMLSSFKGHKDGLSRMEYNWNYIQCSTRMPVECTFGMLKSRFRILLKKNDTQLEKVPDVAAAWLILHNLCVRHGDGFDTSWIDEAKSELQASIESERKSKKYAEQVKCLQIPDNEVVRAAAYGLHRVASVNLNPMEALARSLEQDPNEVASIIAKAPRCTTSIFEANFARRTVLAVALYDKSTRELIHQQFGDHLTDSEDSEHNLKATTMHVPESPFGCRLQVVQKLIIHFPIIE